VIVVTPFLPSAAAVSAAQAHLLAVGAARASILGPESTAAQLAQFVTFALSHVAVTDSLSGSALFANGSARLAPAAVRVLTPLIAPLRKAGATAVINGYASTTGRRTANCLLSAARAARVAAFFESRGIPASSLDVVGHGASDLVAAGPSGANRRVVVVIEEPAAP
jgi:outer membrane protein OmpA-like peptidoglycan-associated protein